MLMAVTMAACGGWMAGHALEKLCWGIAMATAGEEIVFNRCTGCHRLQSGAPL